MDPELYAFSQKGYKYDQLKKRDQQRLNLIRIEALLISQGLENHSLDMNQLRSPANKHIYCVLCYVRIKPHFTLSAIKCGHFFCDDCFNQIESEFCPTCRRKMVKGTEDITNIRFKFNNIRMAICRRCCQQFNEESRLMAFHCGDVYCQDCFDQLDDSCTCGEVLFNVQNYHFRLFADFRLASSST